MVNKSNILPYNVRAILMDAISRSFSYPVSDFYADLANGEFLLSLQKECSVDYLPSSITSVLSNIESGIEKVVKGRTRENLESEYIELFEHNQLQAPLHLYGGLYLKSEGGRLEILQRLTRMYRSYGLDMEEGSEHADHLIVVLEFLSFLYRQAERQKTAEDPSGLKQIQVDIRTIINELGWTKRLDDELVSRQEHPFYLPMSKLLQIVLAQQDE